MRQYRKSFLKHITLQNFRTYFLVILLSHNHFYFEFFSLFTYFLLSLHVNFSANSLTHSQLWLYLPAMLATKNKNHITIMQLVQSLVLWQLSWTWPRGNQDVGKNVSTFVLWFCKTCGPKATYLTDISTKLDMVLDNLSTNNTTPILSKLDNIIEKSSFDNTSTLPSTHISDNSYSNAVKHIISNIVHKSISNHAKHVTELEKCSMCHILHVVPDELDSTEFIKELFTNTLNTDITPT